MGCVSRSRCAVSPRIRARASLELRDELEAHVQLDLPAEHVLAVGQRHLPAEPPLAPVDRGCELDRSAGRAVRIGYRRSVGPACLDRTADAPQLEIAEHANGRVVAEVDAARAKADLGVLTCVEEVLPRHDVLA